MTRGILFRRNTMLGDDWLVGVEGVWLVAKQAYLVACLSEDHGAHERNLSRLLHVDLHHRRRRVLAIALRCGNGRRKQAAADCTLQKKRK